jgi:TM2 domain-containing membrane protein YozV
MALALQELRMQKMSDEERLAFKNEMTKRSKSVGIAYLCWFFFGLHYAYVGKWGLQFLYWFTLAGIFVWALVDLFRMPGIVTHYNDDVADTVALQIGAMRK